MGMTPPRIVGLMIAAAALLVSWVLIELRVPVPMIDMEMMRGRVVWTSNVVAGAVGFGIFASFGSLPRSCRHLLRLVTG